MTISKDQVLRALANFAGALLIVLGAIFFIRKTLIHLSDHWQEPVYVALMVIATAIAGWLGLSFTAGLKEKRRQRFMAWGSLLFTFLYIACAVLCERLSVGMLNYEAWRDIGLLLVLVGWVIRIWAIRTLGSLHSRMVTIQDAHELVERGPYQRLKHPSYLGLLVIYTGTPMVFGSWFPLLALPGVFVALKWRMDAEEELLAEHFGDSYKAYSAGRWRLLPYLY